MRKSLFMTVALSLCMAEFGAFAAAPARGGRPGGGNAPTAARAAQMAKPVNVNTGTKPVAKPTEPGKTRSTGPANNGGSNNGGVTAQQLAGKQSGVIGARAAATKKAINMGTKVATATENTVISKDCQNAYYGCMDAFCMLDNASGGRCQCNDRR